jgi:hypothetical protein
MLYPFFIIRGIMPRKMGLPFNGSYFKRKFRWRFVIRGLIDMENFSSPVLPPTKAARPSISFKEQNIEHLIETIARPMKPEWQPLDITLYDIQCNKNPMFTWLKKLYDPQLGLYKTSVSYIIPEADLELLSGCGDVMETWRYENLWAQKIEWGDLDMTSSDIVTVDVTFKYDRAYYVEVA